MTDEGLKVVITADTSQFNNEVKKVQKTLKRFVGDSERANKAIGKISQTIAGIKIATNSLDKALTSAVKGMAGITTALFGLSKATEGMRINQSKLNTAFRAAGADARTASVAYDGLFRVLGDDDRAVEAANHLAKITTNEQDLAEWTQICEGVFATFGDSLPIEGLTEAVNETIRVGKTTGVLADALNWAGVNEDAFNAKLASASSLGEREAMVRSTLNGLYMDAAVIYEHENQAVIRQNEAQAQLNKTLAELNTVCSPAITSVLSLANAILQALAPAIQFVAVLVSYAAEAIAALFGLNIALGGTANNFKPVAKSIDKSAHSANKFAGSMAGAAGSAKEIKKSLAGFDELNVISETNIGGLGGGVHLPEPGGEGFNEGFGELNKVLPDLNKGLGQFNSGLKWLEEHKDGIVKALQVILGALLAIKAIKGIAKLVSGVSTAFSTLGTILGSVGWAGLIGAIVLGIEGIIIAVSKANSNFSGLTEKEQQLIQKANEAHTAFVNMTEQTEEEEHGIMAEKKRVEDLVAELDELVGANGEVKDSDKERVDYILGELEEATGLELEQTDGVIKNYKEMREKILDVIEAKTAEALLDANRDDYIQALKNQKEASTTLLLAQKDYNDALDDTKFQHMKVGEQKEHCAQIEMRMNRALHEGNYKLYEDLREELDLQKKKTTAFENDALDAETIMKKRGETLEEQKNNYKDYADKVSEYENAMILIQEGHTKEAIDLMTSEGIAYTELDENITEGEGKILEVLSNTATEAQEHAEKVKENWDKGTAHFGDETVEEAEQAATDAYNAWSDAYDKAKGVGDNLGRGLADGLNGTKPHFILEAGNFIQAGINRMRQTAEIASPSKKTKRFGKYLGEGLVVGLEKTQREVDKASRQLAEVSLKPLETTLTVSSFDTKFSMEDNIKPNYNNTQVDYHSDLAKLGQMLANRQDKISINIDGKELGWATIKSINDITHQTGNLQLSLI